MATVGVKELSFSYSSPKVNMFVTAAVSRSRRIPLAVVYKLSSQLPSSARSGKSPCQRMSEFNRFWSHKFR